MKMRRSDREVTDINDILGILDRCRVMRLGLAVGDRPYVVPMNFGYEMAEGKLFIYFHCAGRGRKLEMIARNDRVCFEADCECEIIKNETACGWSADFESVMGEGRIRVLTDAEEKARGLDLIMGKYGFEGKPVYGEGEIERVVVLKLEVGKVSGKIKKS